MANIINAIYNLAINTNSNISETSDSGNRVHSVGVGFETYIKDMFANTFGMADSKKRLYGVMCFLIWEMQIIRLIQCY